MTISPSVHTRSGELKFSSKINRLLPHTFYVTRACRVRLRPVPRRPDVDASTACLWSSGHEAPCNP
jgi:hypothetical protein